MDSLSHLLDVVPDAQKTKEPDDHEFGSYCFEELEPAKVMEKVSTEVIELNDNSEYQNDSQKLRKCRMLTDNGSEFKNKEMQEVCDTLGLKHIFSPVYTPQSNGCLEGWHRFFKACIAKHIRGGGVEWDELVPLAVSAYNFFLCQSSRESPFVLMFGRDPITPVAKLLEPKPRYYGERGAALKMDTLRRLYTIVVQNIHKAREKLPKKEEELHKFKVNDMVLVKDPDAAVFEPRYQPNFRVTAIIGNNRIEVQDE